MRKTQFNRLPVQQRFDVQNRDSAADTSFFEPLKFCWKTPEKGNLAKNLLRPFCCFPILEIACKFFENLFSFFWRLPEKFLEQSPFFFRTLARVSLTSSQEGLFSATSLVSSNPPLQFSLWYGTNVCNL